jgi:hypothetical protein
MEIVGAYTAAVDVPLLSYHLHLRERAEIPMGPDGKTTISTAQTS